MIVVDVEFLCIGVMSAEFAGMGGVQGHYVSHIT